MTWLSSLGTRVAIVLALVIASFSAGFIGGKQWAERKQMADTVEAFQKRGKIDADVGSRDDYQLCIGVGGLPDKCKQLRRVDQAPKGK